MNVKHEIYVKKLHEETDTSTEWQEGCIKYEEPDSASPDFHLTMISDGLKIATTRECAAQILMSPEKDMDAVLEKFVMTITAYPDYVMVGFVDKEKWKRE